MQATTITAEQMNDLMPYVEQYQQEKRDAAAQHEAELKAAEPNYETTTERKSRKSAKKEVRIIARYQFKADPRKVCYLVRSSNGKDVYFACLFNGKATSCQCPSRKPCKHMRLAEEREAQRNHSDEREVALAAARAASEQELAKIEAETMAQIEREEAAEPVGKSEQARLAELPFSDDEKKYSRWTEEMLAAPLNGNHQPVQAPATATTSEQRLAAAGLLRR